MSNEPTGGDRQAREAGQSATERRDEIDAWGRLVAAFVFAFAGLCLAVYVVVFAGADDWKVRLAALALAGAMMGRVIAASLAQIVAAWRHGHER
jgi:hypothetical protein